MDAFQPAVETLRGWLTDIVHTLPHIIAASIAFLFFLMLATIIHRKLKIPLERMFRKSHSADILAKISDCLIYYLCIAVGVLLAASILGLETIFTSMLASVGVVGLVAGYAFKDVAANFFAGAVLSLRRPFKKGDLIEVAETFGSVTDIDLFYTTILTRDGQIVYAPNQSIYASPIVNYSALGARRIVLSTGVSYGDDLEQVREIALETIKSFKFLKPDEPIDLFFTDIGGSSYNFQLRYWIDFENQTQFRDALSEGIIHIKKAFEAEGISIPYPVQTLDFGVKGGVNLADSLEVVEVKKESSR